MTPPRRDGLPDLAAAIEARLLGHASSPALDGPLGSAIPERESYVLVLFDGLGAAQLEHPEAAPFRDSLAGVIESPFPTTTSVALASVVTGLTPARHGLRNSHTISPPGVTSKARPASDSVISVFPFGRRCAVPQVAE